MPIPNAGEEISTALEEPCIEVKEPSPPEKRRRSEVQRLDYAHPPVQAQKKKKPKDRSRKQVESCSIHLDRGVPWGYCDVTAQVVEMGTGWFQSFSADKDLCLLEYDKLEADQKIQFSEIVTVEDLGDQLESYRPTIILQCGDRGRDVQSALRYQWANRDMRLKNVMQKFGLKMSPRRFQQLCKDYNTSDPVRSVTMSPAEQLATTEWLKRAASMRLLELWKEHGKKSVPAGKGARAIIDQLVTENPGWGPFSIRTLTSHTVAREWGESPISQAKKKNYGKRKLTDEIEDKLAEVIIDMDATNNQPTIDQARDEIQRQLDGTHEGDVFRGGHPSKGFIARLVDRAREKGTLDTDTTVLDKDRRMEWWHIKNYTDYYNQVIASLKKGKNWEDFDNFDPDEPFSELGRVLDLARCASADESKLKLAQEKQPGKVAWRIVPFHKGRNHHAQQRKSRAPQTPLLLPCFILSEASVAEKKAGVRKPIAKAVTHVQEHTVNNTITFICAWNGCA